MDFYSIVEKARKTGKIDKGVNEATKAIERGSAKAVFYAGDVTPKEIIQHIPMIAKEKGIPCFEVDSKQKLGIAVGIRVGTDTGTCVGPRDTPVMMVAGATDALGANEVNDTDDELLPPKQTKQASAAVSCSLVTKKQHEKRN